MSDNKKQLYAVTLEQDGETVVYSTRGGLSVFNTLESAKNSQAQAGQPTVIKTFTEGEIVDD